jgi:purine catabolism regulator
VAAAAVNGGVPIGWLHSGDAVTAPDVLRAGDALMVSQLTLERYADAPDALMERLATRGAVALLVEHARSAAPVLDGLAGAAADRGVVLVQMTRPASAVELVRSVHAEILARRHERLEYRTVLWRRMSDALLSSGDIGSVLELAGAQIGARVILERHDARADAGEGRSRALHTAQQRAAQGRSAPVTTSLRGASVDLRLRAIGDIDLASADAQLVSDIAAEVIGLAMTDTDTDDVRGQLRGEFLDDLRRRPSAGSTERARARALDFQTSSETFLAASVVSVASAQQPARRALAARLDARLRPSADVLVGQSGTGGLLAVVAVPPGEDGERARGRLVQALRDVLSINAPDHPTCAAVATAARWDAVPDALRHAAGTADFLAAKGATGVHDASLSELHRLLVSRAPDAALRELTERLLGPIDKHDGRHKHQLLPTLRAFLAADGRKATAARSLHIDRQGLYGRLRRMEDVLEVDLTSPDLRLVLHLGLLARDIDQAFA